jgi:formamidopyrimidine-DNA glycosylase
MPELPEVETTRRGIINHTEGLTLKNIEIRQRQLRWPIPKNLPKQIQNQRILKVNRRGKYLLFHTDKGTLLLHLGMSGSLRIVSHHTRIEKHDHVDLVFTKHRIRFTDPRRFGSVLWTSAPAEQHRLLCHLGPEPLDDNFTGATLYQRSRNKKVSVKQFIMNHHVVVGVGNIYASEALFQAGIHPKRVAGKISQGRYDRLASAIKSVLQAAISAGGTTLKDFNQAGGQPGYFKQALCVYDRAQQACIMCDSSIKKITQGQRSSYYCPQCQR